MIFIKKCIIIIIFFIKDNNLFKSIMSNLNTLWNKSVSSKIYQNTTNFISEPNQFYSQVNQDSSLENCIFKGFKNGFFMDIGAHDGVDANNTLYFETTHNWTGINVEPLKPVYDRLVTNRKNCININCAITNTNGTAKFLQNTGYTEMLSGLLDEYDDRHKNRINRELNTNGGSSEITIVNTKTIESICDEYNINNINYLSIDVEGAEFNVIKSINFNKVFIDVIGFENNYPDVSVDIINYLTNLNYIKLPPHTFDIFMIHKNSQFIKNL